MVGHIFPVLRGRHADTPDEMCNQIAAVGITDLLGNFQNGEGGAGEQHFRLIDPRIDDEFGGRKSGHFLEKAREIVITQSCNLRELMQRNLFSDMGADINDRTVNGIVVFAQAGGFDCIVKQAENLIKPQR